MAGGGGGCCRRAPLYAALPPTCAPYAVHCETHFPSGFGSTSAFSASFCCLTHFLTMCCLARCLLVQGPARATCSPTGGHNDGCQHFSQSVTQTPSTLPLASSKDIQVQVSDAAHSPLVRISQGPLSLEQVAIGMFWLRTGMHQLALEFQVDVHQLQHPLASHSSADFISQLNFGGGPGGIGGVGGGGGTQGAGGSFESFCAHMHMLDEQHAVWFIFLSQVVTDFEQFLAHDATLEHHPVELHGLPHHVQHGWMSHSACVVTEHGPGGSFLRGTPPTVIATMAPTSANADQKNLCIASAVALGRYEILFPKK